MVEIHMYHPSLWPPHNECVARDEAQAQVYEQSGWKRRPEPERKPGYEAEPVRYEPVTGEPAKARGRAAKKTDDD